MITDKQLHALCDRINTATGMPLAPWRTEGGRMVGNVGNFHISFAYGGACLHRMSNESGGVSAPIAMGHVKKRELWDQMHAFLRGLEWRDHGN
jgi:hypothetical protein